MSLSANAELEPTDFIDDDESLLLPAENKLVEKWRLTIDKGQEPLRIDKFLMQRIEGATRNKIQQAIDEGKVLVNAKQIKSNYKVKPTDELVYFEYENNLSSEIVPEPISLNIVYEDDDVLVINKPSGLVVHPGSGNPNGTLINGVAWHFKYNLGINETAIPRLGLVHRIDKNTSGLLLIAKNEKAMAHLAKQFAKHTVHRRYIALVWGSFAEPEGTITGNIGRHQRFRKLFTLYPEGEYGKEAITHYKVLNDWHYVSLVECRLETGRTHQIRVHMQHQGHPIFSDETYGGDKIVKGTVFPKYKQFVENNLALLNRQALHAKELGFEHPSTGKFLKFDSAVPNDMQTVISSWEQYLQAQTKK